VKHGGPFLLVLRYDEEAIEWAPALYSEQACDARQMEANRVREIACVDVLPWDKDRYAGCWTIPEPDRRKERIPCNDDCADTSEQQCADTLEPKCACKYGVPLALVEPVYVAGDDGWNIPREMIHKHGRRELLASERLTHIVDFNWEHGGVVKLSELKSPAKMDGQLRVYFDRPLLDDPANKGTGVNRHTFVVAIHRRADVQYTPQLLFYDRDEANYPKPYRPYIENSEGSCCAVFPIDPRLLTGQVEVGDNTYLYVTLKCDFILDCHHHPVDGNHLKGTTPTGDGHAGGTFESWFRIDNDLRRPHKYED
jgi:hypothetical protein